MKNTGARSVKSGQMLIVVILIMVVALTVGLSIASRTITNLRISRQSEESQRAFQAAEAGIEQIIQSQSRTSSEYFGQNSASFETSASYPQGTSFALNGGDLVDQDTGIDVWLSNYPDFSASVPSTNITLYWSPNPLQANCTNVGGTNPTAVKSAIEVIVLYNNILSPSLFKNVYEPSVCSRIQNAVPVAGGGATLSGITYNYSVTVPVTNGLIMRVIPLFNSSKIALVSSASLPKQGTIVTSTGKAGLTVRKIQYFASYPQIPVEIFPYSLISQ